MDLALIVFGGLVLLFGFVVINHARLADPGLGGHGIKRQMCSTTANDDSLRRVKNIILVDHSGASHPMAILSFISDCSVIICALHNSFNSARLDSRRREPSQVVITHIFLLYRMLLIFEIRGWQPAEMG